MADYIRFSIYKWDDGTRKWVYSGVKITFDYRPMTLRADRKVEWRHRSSGTKRYKVFRWKSRQGDAITFSGECRTSMWRKLEWLATSKVVLKLETSYAEGGKTVDKYPLLHPITPWDGDGSMPTPGADYVANPFYIMTAIDGTSVGYKVVTDASDSSKREFLHQFSVTLERVDTTKITI